MSNQPSEQHRALFEQARQYEAAADPYNAVKLYKRVIKEVPQWQQPYLRLGHMYKYRREWKPALYYNKKAVALEVSNRQAWWDVGLAATALGKLRQARRVWEKFGWNTTGQHSLKPVSVRLQFQNQFEVLWVQRISPCLGYIRSIPQPASGRRYGDLVLIDNMVRGYHSSGMHRLPIYDELGLKKCGHYGTFSCTLLQATEEDIKLLQQLCQEQNMGFEVWGNAAQAATVRSAKGKPEYYAFSRYAAPELLVAIAARQQAEVRSVLKAWEVISLKNFADFRVHQL
ncbi:MAG: hypothetical protein RIC19_19865 [Phaeodactylibacter sp.]|uniref:tetratricopeptide repeat protein n=1 Tax=Phaeodactylibacter sp. TaxID=1940289 RepID=UPI0032EC825C